MCLPAWAAGAKGLWSAGQVAGALAWDCMDLVDGTECHCMVWRGGGDEVRTWHNLILAAKRSFGLIQSVGKGRGTCRSRHPARAVRLSQGALGSGALGRGSQRAQSLPAMVPRAMSFSRGCGIGMQAVQGRRRLCFSFTILFEKEREISCSFLVDLDAPPTARSRHSVCQNPMWATGRPDT